MTTATAKTVGTAAHKAHLADGCTWTPRCAFCVAYRAEAGDTGDED